MTGIRANSASRIDSCNNLLAREVVVAVVASTTAVVDGEKREFDLTLIFVKLEFALFVLRSKTQTNEISSLIPI